MSKMFDGARSSPIDRGDRPFLGRRGASAALSAALTTAVVAVVVMLAGISIAQVPEPPPPTCVSCPTGYHCAHNPERCVPD